MSYSLNNPKNRTRTSIAIPIAHTLATTVSATKI